MNLSPARRHARFVEPEVDEKRIDRVWARVEPARASVWSWRMPALVAAGLVAAVVAVVLVRGRAAPYSLSGMRVEASANQMLTLPDGSTAALRPGARLRFDRIEASRVESTLEQGEVSFDVVHSASRTWMVHAAGFDIVDRGTRFVVTVIGNGVRVQVESGSVAVVRTGSSESPRAIGAGESWTSAPTVDTTPVPAAPVPPSAPAAVPEDREVAPTPPTNAPAEHAAPTAPAPPPPPGPRELLETATAARLAGRPRDAAQAFDTLRTRYRSDSRAGLAAFELGRLRLDALGDPPGAAEAFADAVALAPGGGFREDAEARRVEALERMHDGRCRAAREAYLARYPAGLHAAAVAARCP